jgi:predicted ABC-type ATPase
LPNLYIIAGCNGAGKTTASYTVLPEMLNCKEFVNANEIAKGLSPFQPETVSFEAGRIMLSRIRGLLEQKVDFGFETTLSTRSYTHLIADAKARDQVYLVFIWLESVDLAKDRVKFRVNRGGHNISREVIERRYYRGLSNFFSLYQQLADIWVSTIIHRNNPT